MSEPKTTSEYWMEAKNIKDLGANTIRWLEGTLDWHFSCAGKPAFETGEIADYLKRINSFGFVTDFSQPAIPLEDGFAQRGCVSGYLEEKKAKILSTINLYSELFVLIYELKLFIPNQRYGYSIPITIEEFHPFTWCGPVYGDLLSSFEDILSKDAISALSESWYVVAIDPQWGRKEYLWKTIVERLDNGPEENYSSEPYPGHELDVDFVY